MSKKLYLAVAILIMASILLAACQPAPAATPTPTQPAAPPADTPAPPPTDDTVLACQVTDTGGIDDRSFNATAWKGVEDAMAEMNVDGRVIESQQQADYERNINLFIEENCDLIITVGFLLGEDTANAAQAHPEQYFTIVDFAYDPGFPNVLGLIFATEEAAFLAGYAAAGVTQTGVVGTFGGIQIPPVTVFMDGFYYGVQEYNRRHGTNVEVLGWDPTTETGLFTGNFESLEDGHSMGQTLIAEGADIIMPVAGPVGLGTAEAARDHGNVYIIGVDTDWTVSAPDFVDVTFTSVLKNMDVAVFEAIEMVVENSFEGGVFLGTLENNGVGLAPFHQLDHLVSDQLKAEIEELQQGIINGTISVYP
jgi:basic membrane protein A and related proteins